MYPLILNATTKTIEAVMSGAAATTNPDFTSHYADNDGSAFTEGEQDGALNGTTPVTLVSAPGASTRRVIKSIIIQNRDTAAVTLTISFNNNSTLRQIIVVTIQAGETWSLEGTYTSSGQLKTGFHLIDDPAPTLGGNLLVNGKSIVSASNGNIPLLPNGSGKVIIQKGEFTTQAFFDAEVDNGSSGTSITIDWTVGNKQKLTLTNNCTITLTAPSGVANLILKAINFGAFTPTFSPVPKWTGGAAPAWTASGTDIIAFYWDGADYYGAGTLAFS